MADSLTHFLNAAGRIPLLTPQEEIHLGRTIQAMMAIKDSNPEGPYTREESITIRKGIKARDRMVSANIKLVASAARKYRGHGSKGTLQIEIEDLIQEGTIGLVRAAEKFDPERGYKFSTYSYWWIRQCMFRSITQKGRLIKVPHQIAETMYNSSRRLTALQESLGREPTLAEAAAELKMKPDDFAYALLMTATRPASIDACIVAAGGAWVEMIGTGSADEQLAKTDREIQTQRLIDHLHQMDPEHRETLVLVYGLDGSEPPSLHALSRERGVTREALRQKVKRAEKALRLRMAVA